MLLVVSNVFLYSPLFGEVIQFDKHIFSFGLKPPTSHILPKFDTEPEDSVDGRNPAPVDLENLQNIGLYV